MGSKSKTPGSSRRNRCVPPLTLKKMSFSLPKKSPGHYFWTEDLSILEILEPDAIFSSWKAGQEIQVVQHHKDYMSNLPSEFVCLAESETHNVEAMKHKSKPIYGVQAHIERATDEHPAGSLILKNFMLKVVEKIKAIKTDMNG